MRSARATTVAVRVRDAWSSARERSPLFREVVALRRRAWQLAQLFDPVRLVLPRLSMAGSIGLVCVYRGHNVDNVRALLRRLPDGSAARLWSLDASVPPDLAELTVGTGPGWRFALLNELVRALPEGGRDTLVLVDDDVRFRVGDLTGLVAVGQRGGLDLYQPAHTARSFAGYRFVRRRRLTVLRRTDFVEQGPLVALSARAQRVVLPLPEDLGMGWGTEVRWWSAAHEHGLALGIVDAVAVQHLAPTASGYDRTDQLGHLDDELARVGLTDVGQMQQTFTRVGLGRVWRRSAPRDHGDP